MHPEARAVLDRIAARGEGPMEEMTPVQARQTADARVIAFNITGPTDLQVEDRTVPGPGGPIPIRLYRPQRSARPGPLPIAIYIHGGGMVVGGIEVCDAQCRVLAKEVDCLVVSPEYRLAPEHKFPAAPDDAWAVTTWVQDHAAALGGDPQRIALAGESSGGNLSAVISHRMRDAGRTGIVLQILIYPSTDMSVEGPGFQRLGEGNFLTKKKSAWFRNHYMRSEADRDDPLASPLRAKNFAGLPPALIITGGLDPLVDDGEAYADKLKAAGVPVDYRCFEGWPHGFVYWAGTWACAETIALCRQALLKAFAT